MAKKLDGVIWVFTASCPLRCRHCYTVLFQGSYELSLEEKLRLVDEFAEVGVHWVNLTGGEPIGHPHFLPVVERLNDYGILVYINTNGVRVTEAVARELSRLVDGVYVSIDGGRRGHELLRGPGTFDKAVRAVELLKRAGVHVVTVMAVSEVNSSEVRDYLTLCSRLGIEEPAMIPVMNQGRARVEGLAVKPATYLKAVLEASRVAEELGLAGVWLWCTPFAQILGRPNLTNTYCRILDIVDVGPSGELLLCDISGVKVADVRKGFARALEEYENSPLVREVVAPPRLPEPCRNCPISELCRGGCFARSIMEYGEPNRGDPLCPRIAGLLGST